MEQYLSPNAELMTLAITATMSVTDIILLEVAMRSFASKYYFVCSPGRFSYGLYSYQLNQMRKKCSAL